MTAKPRRRPSFWVGLLLLLTCAANLYLTGQQAARYPYGNLLGMASIGTFFVLALSTMGYLAGEVCFHCHTLNSDTCNCPPDPRERRHRILRRLARPFMQLADVVEQLTERTRPR